MFKKLFLVFSLVLVLLVTVGLVFAANNTPTAQQDEQNDANALTYYRDVHAIIAQNCMGCHTEGGIGVSFEDPNVLSQNARDIAYAVSTRYMPPWMPGEASPAMVGHRGLTQDEIDTIVAWTEAGAPLGDPATMPEIPVVEIPEIREDVVLEMPVPYTPDDSLQDDYRCFLLDADLPEDRFVTGYTVEPGQDRIVHHVLLYQLPESAREDAERRAAEDDRPGWQCFGGPGVTGSGALRGNTRGEDWVSPGGSIAGSIGAWAPGTLQTFFPEGTGAQLYADGVIVMQVHYNLQAGVDADQTRAVFQLADPDADIIPLNAYNMVAPVEIPCAENAESALCDRDMAIAESDRFAQRRSGGLMFLCNHSLDDFTSQDASAVTSTCDYRLQNDWVALGAAGHMHELGTVFSIERNPDTDEAQVLLDIPEWDFHWQGSYQYIEPVYLNAGDVLRISCTWDNSDGERYIVWGEGTQDEMCLGAVTLIPPPSGS